MTTHGLTPQQVKAWVESSCLSQGLPVRVTEPGVLARVGVLFGGTRGAPLGRRDRLQPPLGSNPLGV